MEKNIDKFNALSFSILSTLADSFPLPTYLEWNYLHRLLSDLHLDMEDEDGSDKVTTQGIRNAAATQAEIDSLSQKIEELRKEQKGIDPKLIKFGMTMEQNKLTEGERLSEQDLQEKADIESRERSRKPNDRIFELKRQIIDLQKEPINLYDVFTSTLEFWTNEKYVRNDGDDKYVLTAKGLSSLNIKIKVEGMVEGSELGYRYTSPIENMEKVKDSPGIKKEMIKNIIVATISNVLSNGQTYQTLLSGLGS